MPVIPLLIIVGLVSTFFAIVSISPVYGIAFLTGIRTLSLLANVKVGSYEYSAEGFLTLLIILFGFIFILMHRQSLKGVSKWPFLIFIICCAFTCFVAEDTTNFSKKLARLIGYALLYVMVVQLSLKKENRTIFGYAFVASMIITDAPAIYEYCAAPERYMKLLYGGETGLSEMGIMAKNNFGLYCCYMVLFLIYLYSTVKVKRFKVLFLTIFVIQAALLVLSATRSAWVGFAAALPVFMFYSKKKARLLVPILGIMIVAASLYPILHYGAYQDLTEKKRYGFSSWHFRVAYAWPASIRAFEEKPIMGWGLGNDLLALSEAGKLQATSHSDYLLVLVETGLMGLSLYLWLLWSLFRQTAKGIRDAKDESSRLLCVAALAILVSYLVASCAEHLLQTPGATGYVITVLAMAHGTIVTSDRRAKLEFEEEIAQYSKLSA